MRFDLEAVTMAIDRLYMVAPQLHNQRVELKTSKVKEMEKARLAGQSSSSKSTVSEGKQRERDVKELEGILDLIGKASDRKMTDQLVVLEGGMKARLEKARQRDLAKVRISNRDSMLSGELTESVQRDAFVEQLANHSDAGRLHAQDAVLQHPKSKDLDAPMTLPEFLRESMTDCQQGRKSADPDDLLTLHELLREPTPDHVAAKSPGIGRLKKKSRHRSMSAPSLFWLIPSSSKSSGSSSPAKKPRSRPGTSMDTEPTTNCEFSRFVLSVTS
jgi:ubiquitin-protein ligase E3 D